MRPVGYFAMKVLVADKFEKSGLDGLAKLGAEVLYEPELQGNSLEARLGDSEADVLVVRSTKVTASMVENSKLGVIIRAGAGTNTIDVQAASQRGVMVTNCPGKNSQAVAELAFGLIVACDRRIADNVADLRAGKWNKKEYSQSRGLYGRTLGLVGTGNIAQEMIPKAKAFGMNVAGHGRWLTPDIAAGMAIGRANDLEELALMSDIISVHVALTPETRGSLDATFFNALRPGAIFVNTSRAEVVDQDALLKAVREKGVRAGLDVFEGEPEAAVGSYDGVLRDLPGVYCTHHIGASTEQAQESIAAEVVRIVREYKLNGTVPNVVNVKKADVATHLLVVRHLDRVGVLAHVLGVLKDEGVNVQEMENIVLGGATAAIAQISVSQAPTKDALLAIKMNPNVFDASVFPIERQS
jgi:D-3-phosphoglycerate dehydrogenase